MISKRKLLALTLLALIVPVLFFGLVSCMKAPDHAANYGPEVSAEDVNNALNELGFIDPGTIQKGEFAYSETTQALDTQAPLLIKQSGITVTNRVEQTDSFIITVVNELSELINGSMQSSHTTTDYVVEKVLQASSLQTQSSSKDSSVYGKELSYKQMLKTAEETPQRVTFHNLKKSVGFYAIPEAVRARPGCGGLADCSRSLRVSVVSVDRVTWQSADRGTKVSFEYVVSPDVPYWANQLVGCAQAWIDYPTEQGNRVLAVRECQTVKDFKFGSASP